ECLLKISYFYWLAKMQKFTVIGDGFFGDGAVIIIRPSHNFHYQGIVLHIGGKNTNGVKRRGICDQAVTRHPGIGRFNSNYPRKGGWLSYRPPGISPQGNRAESCLDSYC